MKDWGWEKREAGTALGLFLNLEADFSRGSADYLWFRELKLQHYQLYEGPFREFAGAYEEPVCAFLEQEFYQELVGNLARGERISYGSYFHYALLTPGWLSLIRAWGMGGTEDSDCALLRQLLERGISIGEWFIQDLDYGNEWIRDHGTESFRTYLEA